MPKMAGILGAVPNLGRTREPSESARGGRLGCRCVCEWVCVCVQERDEEERECHSGAIHLRGT